MNKTQKTQSVTLSIRGRFISKKNSRRVLKNRRTGRRFNAPSEAFENYKADAIKQIRKQAIPPIESPYHIKYFFGVKGQNRIDVDNAMASINDILQDAGIIDNDTNVLTGQFEKQLGGTDWCVMLEISSLSL